MFKLARSSQFASALKGAYVCPSCRHVRCLAGVSSKS